MLWENKGYTCDQHVLIKATKYWILWNVLMHPPSTHPQKKRRQKTTNKDKGRINNENECQKVDWDGELNMDDLELQSELIWVTRQLAMTTQKILPNLTFWIVLEELSLPDWTVIWACKTIVSKLDYLHHTFAYHGLQIWSKSTNNKNESS